MTQQGDVRLFQTDDDGEITVTDGVAEMSGGLETSAYLSLFGGNEDDDGSSGTPLQYWGNFMETAKARTYRSETQNLLRSIPATSFNILRIEAAARRDLQWFLDERVASSVEVAASIPGINRLGLVVTIQAEGLESSFEYVENWKATQ